MTLAKKSSTIAFQFIRSSFKQNPNGDGIGNRCVPMFLLFLLGMFMRHVATVEFQIGVCPDHCLTPSTLSIILRRQKNIVPPQTKKITFLKKLVIKKSVEDETQNVILRKNKLESREQTLNALFGRLGFSKVQCKQKRSV